jgi:hypothetical protein
MANAIARKAMAQSVTSSSLAASGWNQVFGNGAMPSGPATKVRHPVYDGRDFAPLETPA